MLCLAMLKTLMRLPEKPAAIIQLPQLLAVSESFRRLSKCSAPRRQSTPSEWQRKEATFCLPRLLMNPVLASSLMFASTSGLPVFPSIHAPNAASAAGPCLQRTPPFLDTPVAAKMRLPCFRA